MKKCLTILSFLLLFFSCGGETKKPVYEDVEEATEEITGETAEETRIENTPTQNGEEIIVPFRNENGTKYVQVKINGISLEMIFDTGCSTTSISVAEANYLHQKGALTSEDILGEEQMSIADGSIVTGMVVNLREVVIDNKIRCPNVRAHVSESSNAPLLLGNEILDRLATITINNENETLHFKLK